MVFTCWYNKQQRTPNIKQTNVLGHVTESCFLFLTFKGFVVKNELLTQKQTQSLDRFNTI